ncbi:MAG TPA: hypothetical protein VIY27_12995, partial [Myxococcota bacterium]
MKSATRRSSARRAVRSPARRATRSPAGSATRRSPRGAGSERAPAAASGDGAIVASVAVLLGLGIVMNYSTTAGLDLGEAIPALTARHLAGVALALLCGGAASRLPLRLWRRLAPLLWAVATG